MTVIVIYNSSEKGVYMGVVKGRRGDRVREKELAELKPCGEASRSRSFPSQLTLLLLTHSHSSLTIQPPKNFISSTTSRDSCYYNNDTNV